MVAPGRRARGGPRTRAVAAAAGTAPYRFQRSATGPATVCRTCATTTRRCSRTRSSASTTSRSTPSASGAWRASRDPTGAAPSSRTCRSIARSRGPSWCRSRAAPCCPSRGAGTWWTRMPRVRCRTCCATTSCATTGRPAWSSRTTPKTGATHRKPAAASSRGATRTTTRWGSATPAPWRACRAPWMAGASSARRMRGVSSAAGPSSWTRRAGLSCGPRARGEPMAVVASESQIARALLTLEVQEFLYQEADLLDARRFAEWLDLFAEDMRYFMPMRRNVGSAHPELEMTREQQDVCWMDESKPTLAKRVAQLLTGVHWAEEPYSRVCHMVSNVRVLEATEAQVTVGCRFLVYRNRQTEDTELFVGRRTDVLRREGDQWRIARREILLDQNVLLANNLTVFF